MTQAFVHADMDELIITREPKELDGVKIKKGDDETVLYEGMWLIVLKALYGYRKSPKLLQAHFLKVLMELTCVNLMCLKSEPFMFVDMKSKVVGIVHVDDALLLGSASRCLRILEEIKIQVVMRETGRATKTGDEVEFVGKKIIMMQDGFEIQGSLKVVESIIKDAKVSQCKSVDTPVVRFTTGQRETAAELDPDSAHHYRTVLGKLM